LPSLLRLAGLLWHAQASTRCHTVHTNSIAGFPENRPAHASSHTSRARQAHQHTSTIIKQYSNLNYSSPVAIYSKNIGNNIVDDKRVIAAWWWL